MACRLPEQSPDATAAALDIEFKLQFEPQLKLQSAFQFKLKPKLKPKPKFEPESESELRPIPKPGPRPERKFGVVQLGGERFCRCTVWRNLAGQSGCRNRQRFTAQRQCCWRD